MLKDSNRILKFVLSEIFLSSSRIGRSETAKILRSVAMTSLVLSTFVTPELRASRSIVTVSFDILIYIVGGVMQRSILLIFILYQPI